MPHVPQGSTRTRALLLLAACIGAAVSASPVAAQRYSDCTSFTTNPPVTSLSPGGSFDTNEVTLYVYYSGDDALNQGTAQVNPGTATILSRTFWWTDEDCQRNAIERLTVRLAAGDNTITASISDVRGRQSNVASEVFRYVEPPPPPLHAKPVLRQVTSGDHRNVAVCDGCAEVTLSHTTPAYVSLDQERSVTLFYSDVQARPRGYVEIDATDNSQQPADRMTLRLLYWNGTPLMTETHFATQGGVNRLGAQFFFSPHVETGRYTYTAEVTSWWGTHSETTTLPVHVLNVNEQASPFGQGWTIAGLARLHIGTHVTLSGGDGSVTWFETTSCNGAACSYKSPHGDFTTLQRYANAQGQTEYSRRFQDGTFQYFDATGRLVRVADRYGNTTTYAYIGGLLASITDPVGLQTVFTYHGGYVSGSYLQSIVDPAGRATQFGYNGIQLTHITDPAWQYALRPLYNSANALTGWVDERNQTWTVSLDAVTRRLSAIQAPAITERIGQATATVRPTTTITSREHRVLPRSGFGTLSSPAPAPRPDSVYLTAVDPKGATTKVWSDGFGHATRVVEPDLRVWSITRNADGWPQHVTDGAANATSYGYKSFGTAPYGRPLMRLWSVLEQTSAGASQQHFRDYNALEQPTRIILGPDDSSSSPQMHVHYKTDGSPERQIMQYRDGTGTIVRADTAIYTSDSRGRWTSTKNPHGVTTSASYHAGGLQNLSRIHHPGGTWTEYGYDTAGRVNQVKEAGGATSRAFYNALNRPDSTRDARGVTTRYVWYPNQRDLYYVHDALNQRRYFHYNALGWVSSEVDAHYRYTILSLRPRRQRHAAGEPGGSRSGRDLRPPGPGAHAHGRWGDDQLRLRSRPTLHVGEQQREHGHAEVWPGWSSDGVDHPEAGQPAVRVWPDHRDGNERVHPDGPRGGEQPHAPRHFVQREPVGSAAPEALGWQPGDHQGLGRHDHDRLRQAGTDGGGAAPRRLPDEPRVHAS
jgi:YD repeat-containing protein